MTRRGQGEMLPVNPEEIERFKKVNLIGMSIIASTVMYAVIAYLLDRIGMDHPGAPKILFTAFLAIGALLFVPLFMLRKKRDAARCDQAAGQTFLSLSVALFAMAEAPALMGFVLFILTGSWQEFAALLVLCSFYFSFVWPGQGGT
jgi:F0F1-type ATP synthase membrane subunit c/vacuolar-type H+-ATPase subunit K